MTLDATKLDIINKQTYCCNTKMKYDTWNTLWDVPVYYCNKCQKRKTIFFIPNISMNKDIKKPPRLSSAEIFKLYRNNPNIKWENTDSAYWKTIKREIQEVYHDHKAFKLIKQYRYQIRQRKIEDKVYRETISPDYVDMAKRYGIVVAAYLSTVMAKITKDYCCVDNIRVCKVSSNRERKHYNKARKNGCCGFYDEKIKFLGKTYIIGFNYGH